MTEELDRSMMERALARAAEADHRVDPNPRVGAVLARGAEVLSEGCTAPYGGPHAERVALDALAEEQRQLGLADATLYVTLEPCSHHGQTPPCADAIIAAGVGRVVAAQRDPNPRVDGRGFERLQRAGVQVEVGLCEKEARAHLAVFNKFMLTGRPYVTAKWAMSLDGKIAAAGGDSQWITGPLARAEGHRLRGESDAVVVGIGTALRDDPRLTRRDAPGKDPARVVIDSRARIDPSLSFVADAGDIPTYLVTTGAASAEKIARLRAKGVNVIELPSQGRRVDLDAFLDECGRRGWRHLLVEGGGELLGSFFQRDFVDRVACFIAPKVIGGSAAPSPAGGSGVSRVADALTASPLRACSLGPDLMITSFLHEW